MALGSESKCNPRRPIRRQWSFHEVSALELATNSNQPEIEYEYSFVVFDDLEEHGLWRFHEYPRRAEARFTYDPRIQLEEPVYFIGGSRDLIAIVR